MTTTNYHDTFIVVSEDTSATEGTRPPVRANPSVAARIHQMVEEQPYEFTSDDVIFTTYANRNDIPLAERAVAREHFFSKGQACLRAADIAKRYGWGIHSDTQGRIALYGVESDEYARLASGQPLKPGDPPVTVKRAMRSKR